MKLGGLLQIKFSSCCAPELTLGHGAHPSGIPYFILDKTSIYCLLFCFVFTFPSYDLDLSLKALFTKLVVQFQRPFFPLRWVRFFLGVISHIREKVHGFRKMITFA